MAASLTMRQIDHMSDSELDTLRLKWMITKAEFLNDYPDPHEDCAACAGTGFVIQDGQRVECPMEDSQ